MCKYILHCCNNLSLCATTLTWPHTNVVSARAWKHVQVKLVDTRFIQLHVTRMRQRLRSLCTRPVPRIFRPPVSCISSWHRLLSDFHDLFDTLPAGYINSISTISISLFTVSLKARRMFWDYLMISLSFFLVLTYLQICCWHCYDTFEFQLNCTAVLESGISYTYDAYDPSCLTEPNSTWTTLFCPVVRSWRPWWLRPYNITFVMWVVDSMWFISCMHSNFTTCHYCKAWHSVPNTWVPCFWVVVEDLEIKEPWELCSVASCRNTQASLGAGYIRT